MNFSPKTALTPPCSIRDMVTALGHLLSPSNLPKGDLWVGEEGWGVGACY
jgi:hypothetical protein